MKAKYRIRNWNDYNKSLIQRGSLTVWFSEDALKKWMAPRVGKRGRPKLFSDEAILTALMIRAVFHLPLRALHWSRLYLNPSNGHLQMGRMIPSNAMQPI